MSIRLDKLLSNLGYGSRKDAEYWAKTGQLTDREGRPFKKASQKVEPENVLFAGEVLDPPELLILMNKPAGYTCSHRDTPPLVYELLPDRFSRRKPALSTIGRLDKDTTGVLLLTDMGQLLHRLIAPVWNKSKIYQVQTSQVVTDVQVEKLSQGGWCLEGDEKPLAPAQCEKTGPHSLQLILTEGRYHQVKRMMSAVENPLVKLHRSHFAGLELGDLKPGRWRFLDAVEKESLQELVSSKA